MAYFCTERCERKAGNGHRPVQIEALSAQARPGTIKHRDSICKSSRITAPLHVCIDG